MQLRAVGHFCFPKLYCALEPRLVGLLAGHELAKIAYFEGLCEVLIVVQRLETFAFEIDQLEIKALGPGEPVPMRFGDALRDETLVGRVHGKCNESIDEGGFTLDPRSNSLGGHIATVDHR